MRRASKRHAKEEYAAGSDVCAVSVQTNVGACTAAKDDRNEKEVESAECGGERVRTWASDARVDLLEVAAPGERDPLEQQAAPLLRHSFGGC